MNVCAWKWLSIADTMNEDKVDEERHEEEEEEDEKKAIPIKSKQKSGKQTWCYL